MEKTKEGVHHLTQSEGLSHIENYYRSGLRPSDYYRQHGLTEYQFYGWHKRYLTLHPEVESLAGAKKKFHPVKIESPIETRLCGLEIHYPHGVRVVAGSDHPIEIEKLLTLIKLRV